VYKKLEITDMLFRHELVDKFIWT